ncbi:MAG: molybdenum cofactor guanylyltransferase [Planctomycetes bacterium]|nr:molybdenum cofactor guanylyltransferase [Planctomycetota bacterium]
MWPHTVAILIGGQSKRMGSPKHEVILPNGKTMLEMMLEFASSVGKRTVILGGDIDGQHCIHDLRKQHGPVAGIEALLHSKIDTNYLVVGCDMPSITNKDVRPLLECHNSAVFSFENRLLGLPLHITSEQLQTCSEYLDSGGRSIHGFIAEVPHKEIKLTINKANTLMSCNSADDIKRMFKL